MIESIYSNENKEADHTNRGQAAFKMPKNIRQIGKNGGTKQIYAEDYVMTFIKQLAGEDYSNCKIAVLVGEIVKIDGIRNIFIAGAIEVEDMDTSNDILFTNDIWTGIYDNIKKYFVNLEIVGWFVGGASYLLEDEDKILKAHVDNFAGQDKTLLVYDNMEKEEAFYLYENNHLNKQTGYYIYYEKNEDMQNYMVNHHKTQSEEETYDDHVSREIRAVIQNKKPPVEQETKTQPKLMYAAGTLLAIIALVVGAAMLSNYDQMKNMRSTMDSLSSNFEKVESILNNGKVTPKPTESPKTQVQQDKAEDQQPEEAGALTADNNSLDIQVVPGNVEPLADADKEEVQSQDDQEEAAAAQEPTQAPTKAPKPTKKPDKPAKAQKDDGSDTVEVQSPEQINYYTVESGDTLVGICVKLYHSTNNYSKILALNNLEDENKLVIGQKLIVP